MIVDGGWCCRCHSSCRVSEGARLASNLPPSAPADETLTQVLGRGRLLDEQVDLGLHIDRSAEVGSLELVLDAVENCDRLAIRFLCLLWVVVHRHDASAIGYVVRMWMLMLSVRITKLLKKSK